jgi:coenzyme F420-reducing hydrogenase gamma subunit
MAKKIKKRIGIFSFTCDEGCSVYLVEIFNKKLLGWLEKIELAYFLTIKDKTEIKNFDIAIIEGIISTEHEKKEIEKIRKNSKVLIALGTCAISGLPSGQRNTFNESQMAEIKDELKQYDYLPQCLSVKEAVKVDDEVMGCPIDENKFIEVFEKYIN